MSDVSAVSDEPVVAPPIHVSAPLAQDARGAKRVPNVIVRVPDADLKQFKRPYAYWSWVPSQGYLYGNAFPGGEIVMSPMTTSEERILAQQKQDRTETLNTLLQRCLVQCPVKYDDLLIPDMLYMLLMLRNISYGSDYNFTLKCAECRTEYRHTLRIPDGLELKVLSQEDGEEPWDVKLPMSGHTVDYRLLRVKDETDIRRWARKQYQRTVLPGDPAYTYRLAKHIVAVNGEEWDAVKRLDYVEAMHTRDSLALRNAVEGKEFGVTLTIEAECPHCGEGSEEYRLPFDREFFRPSDTPSES